MARATRIDGNVPSANLEARLEYEAERLGTDIEFEERLVEMATASEFAPKPYVHLQRIGEERSFEFPIPDSDASVELRARRPTIEADDAEYVPDEDTGLALVIERDVFVLIPFDELFDDPGHVDTEELETTPEEATKRLFDAVVRPALERALENIADYEYEEERSGYVDAKLRGREDDYREWQRDLRDKRGEIDHASNRVERLARELVDIRDRIEAFEDHAETKVRDRIDEEFDELVRMVPEPFTHLRVSGDQLRVVTEPISIRHAGRTYHFGQFRIEVSLRDVSLEIHPHDDNQRAEEYYHPHITPNGSPCWGNVGPGISQLLGERKIAEALPVVLQFLKSYSQTAPYIEIENFNARFSD